MITEIKGCDLPLEANMANKIKALAEMKMMGRNIDAEMQKLFDTHGKQEVENAIICFGYAKTFGIKTPW